MSLDHDATRHGASASASASLGSRRTWVVLVFGPGMPLVRAASGVAGAMRFRLNDAELYETRCEVPAARGGRPALVVVRGFAGEPPGEAAARLLGGDADACIFLPDPDECAAGRNRRALRRWLGLLQHEGCDPAEVPWFVADERASAGAAHTAGLELAASLRTVLPGADFTDAARSAVAVLAGESADGGARTGTRRAPRSAVHARGARPRKLDLALCALLAAAFAAALAAAIV
jgi:hypothetical protein